MKIVGQRIVDGQKHIYYLSDQREMRGYVWHMSSESKLKPGKLVFIGWLCSLAAWERTFKKTFGICQNH